METLIANADATTTAELTPETMWIPFLIIVLPPLVLMIWFYWSDKRLRDRRSRESRE